MLAGRFVLGLFEGSVADVGFAESAPVIGLRGGQRLLVDQDWG